MSKKKVMAGILAAGAAAAVLGTLFVSIRAKKAETVMVSRGHVEDFYTEEGVWRGGKTYEIIAEVSGGVEEAAAQENARVKKGDVLLVVDKSDYEYEKYMADCRIAGYEAQLEESRIGRLMSSSPGEYLDEIRQEVSVRESEYQTARTVYEGSQVLFQSGDISKVELEQREAEYQRSLLAFEQAKSRYEESSRTLSKLEAEGLGESQIDDWFYESEERQLAMLIEAQKAAAAQLEKKIEKCRITAPADGIIRELPTKDLSVIQAGQTVASMTGEEGNTVEADVLTNIAPYLKSGDPVEIVLKLRGKDLSFAGRISQVYDFARQGTSSLGLDEYRVHVVVEVDEGQTGELSGMEGYGVKVKFCLFD